MLVQKWINLTLFGISKVAVKQHVNAALNDQLEHRHFSFSENVYTATDSCLM